jgi:hypothetical protein
VPTGRHPQRVLRRRHGLVGEQERVGGAIGVRLGVGEQPPHRVDLPLDP